MPAIWLIDAYRAGERGQVRALAEAAADRLGLPLVTLDLDYRAWAIWPHLLRRASLAGLRPASREALVAPWPALVITAGVRNEPVGRWLREASGGQTRYIHVGRPWGALDTFDLLVTTPQYRVPEHPRVLHNELTLHGLNPERLAIAADDWAPRFASLPRPWSGVLVGGDSGPHTLGPRAAERLVEAAVARARASGGSLLLTTSARTRPDVVETLARYLATDDSCPHYLYVYGDSRGNPYAGILALADEFVVTADSIAMLSEACASSRPVGMFDLGRMRQDAGVVDAARSACDSRAGATLYRLLMNWFPDSLSRDISLVHRALVDAGRASWLEDMPPMTIAVGHSGGRSEDLDRAVARIASLCP